MTRVIGVDVSLTSTGLAVIEDGKLVDVGNIKSESRRNPQPADYVKRFHFIMCHFELALLRHDDTFDLAVIEAPSYGSAGGRPHERAGLWWAIVEEFVERGVPVATVAPASRAKYITGDGRAKKDVVLAHAIERYVVPGGPRILNDDEADAVGMADMGARHLGISPVSDELMPEANLMPMGVVKWPTS